MIAKLIPHAWSFATTAWARTVKILSSVTKVPSTSETSVEIFGKEFQCTVSLRFNGAGAVDGAPVSAVTCQKRVRFTRS